MLAAYAELDAVTAGIPAGLATARPPETIRKSHNKKLIQRGTAAGAGTSVAVATTVAVAARGNPVISLVVVGVIGVVVAVLAAGLLTLISRVLDMASGRQPSPRPPPGPGSKAAQRLASAGSARSASQISRDLPHTAEAGRCHLPGRVYPG